MFSCTELTSSSSVASKDQRAPATRGSSFLTVGNTPLPPLVTLTASSSFLSLGILLLLPFFNMSKPSLAELSREVLCFLITQSFYIYVYLICTSLSFLWLEDILLDGYTVIYNQFLNIPHLVPWYLEYCLSMSSVSVGKFLEKALVCQGFVNFKCWYILSNYPQRGCQFIVPQTMKENDYPKLINKMYFWQFNRLKLYFINI